MLSEKDKVKFQIALSEVVKYAKVQKRKLTEQEIESFFREIALTKEHYHQIYAYLLANQIQVESEIVLQKDIQKYEEKQKEYKTISVHEEKKTKEKESQYLAIYLQDLKSISPCTKEEEQELYEKLLKGDKMAWNRLAEGKLFRVVEIAKNYVDSALVTEDVIQEGNMGLLTALSELLNKNNCQDCETMIDNYIKQWIASAIDRQNQRKERENRILAKINLVHEAAHVLAEEFGRIATVSELMEYTKLSLEEMEDILELSEGSIDIGNGDIRPDKKRGE